MNKHICKKCQKGQLIPITIGDKQLNFECEICNAKHNNKGELYEKY